jgi:putative acetyltransferase
MYEHEDDKSAGEFNMNILIDDERVEDAMEIHDVTKAAFLHAPHTDHTEQFIVDALRRAGALTLSKTAKTEGQLVGHAAISPVKLSGGEDGWFGLGPVSVLPEFQRRGVGTLLIKNALAALEAMGASGCVVLGDPEYYGRFGFKRIDGLTYSDVPPEYFQAISFSGNFPQGDVSYHDSFFVRN